MALEAGIQTLPGVEAGADLSSNQFHFVKFSSGQAVLCSAAGEDSIGVLVDKPSAAGQAASVAYRGQVKVVVGSGGALSVGDKVATDASGEAKAASAGNVDATSASTTEPLKGSFVMGVCIVAAAVGALATIDLNPQGLIPGTAE